MGRRPPRYWTLVPLRRAARAGTLSCMGSLRILVVDDEPDLSDVLAELLTGEGHQVILAADGRAAVAVLAEEPIDLIISDVLMPEFDGPALYREVEQRWPALLRRFIWTSGETSRETRAAAVVEASGAPLLKTSRSRSCSLR